jgi:type II secretory pathway pseudopilin PulG
MRRNRDAFTMIEIVIAIFILMILLMVGVPSMNGVMADRRLRRSFDNLNVLVRTAQERAVAERRPYLIVWEKDRVVVRPEFLRAGEEESATAVLPMERGDAMQLDLPAALTEEVGPAWTFWPGGTCEPAVIRFKGVDGTWTANYSTLAARGELLSYAPR